MFIKFLVKCSKREVELAVNINHIQAIEPCLLDEDESLIMISGVKTRVHENYKSIIQRIDFIMENQ